jgi:hypothetical protein
MAGESPGTKLQSRITGVFLSPCSIIFFCCTTVSYRLYGRLYGGIKVEQGAPFRASSSASLSACEVKFTGLAQTLGQLKQSLKGILDQTAGQVENYGSTL